MLLYMQITIPDAVVCDTTLNKQNEKTLVDEHAFQLTEFVCESAHVTLLPRNRN